MARRASQQLPVCVHGDAELPLENSVGTGKRGSRYEVFLRAFADDRYRQPVDNTLVNLDFLSSVSGVSWRRLYDELQYMPSPKLGRNSGISRDANTDDTEPFWAWSEIRAWLARRYNLTLPECLPVGFDPMRVRQPDGKLSRLLGHRQRKRDSDERKRENGKPTETRFVEDACKKTAAAKRPWLEPR